MLRVDNLQFRRGEDLLFDELSFAVHPGQRVAVAGRNGVGKSTLFELIRGTLQADTGEIFMPANWKIGYMRQEVAATQRPAIEYVLDGDQGLRAVEAQLDEISLATDFDADRLARLHSDYEDLGGYTAEARAASILSGLGFAAQEFTKPFADFSGGWRIRLNLAQALMSPCDLLLLDEPTNHLDLEAIIWLENWLKQFPGTVIFIAHDRAFLDACANHILHLAGESGELFTGNYSSCERQRAERAILAQALKTKRDAQAAHMQKFIDRFRAKDSKAKQVQSRIKALERLADGPTIHVDSTYSVTFQDPDKVSNPLFSAHRLALGYGDTPVLSDVGFSILPGARIGVLGANGAGKTTLLRAMVGDLAPMSGEIVPGRHSSVGYFAQHQLELLDPKASALEMFARLRPNWREQQSRDYLGRWGFDSGMITRNITTLSGGEKARLVLASIALENPAVLVLDEPTNHLDLDMRDALAFALQDYAGAVVIVSHDRVLLNKTVDELWVLADGSLSSYTGDLSDYTATRKDGPKAASAPKAANSKKAQRKERASNRSSLKQLRNNVRSLERDLDKYSKKLASIESTLADSDTYDTLPKQEFDQLLADADKYRSLVEKTEEQWLQASDKLESSQQEDAESEESSA